MQICNGIGLADPPPKVQQAGLLISLFVTLRWSVWMRASPSLLPAIVLLGVLIFPVASIVASLIGLGLFLVGKAEAALWTCGITWGITMIVTPMAVWILSRPDRRASA